MANALDWPPSAPPYGVCMWNNDGSITQSCAANAIVECMPHLYKDNNDVLCSKRYYIFVRLRLAPAAYCIVQTAYIYLVRAEHTEADVATAMGYLTAVIPLLQEIFERMLGTEAGVMTFSEPPFPRCNTWAPSNVWKNALAATKLAAIGQMSTAHFSNIVVRDMQLIWC